MRVDDIEGPVVSAATRTPFEARRRVFVLERVDTMNDEVANRLLKTLEEPAAFVHLILMTDALGRVLETVVSRCQLVRFEPLPAATIASQPCSRGGDRASAGRMRTACARQHDARSLSLVGGGGGAAEEVDGWCAACALGRIRDAGGAEPCDRCWRARRHPRLAAEEAVAAEAPREARELEPKGRDRKAMEREFEEVAKRESRRARTEVAGARARH